MRAVFCGAALLLQANLVVPALAAQKLPPPFDIDPSHAHPRNTEGSYITLKSGRILFAYSRFSGGRSDYDRSEIVQIHSDDQGRTWSEPQIVVPTGNYTNVMSVSFLRLASGKIARFHLVKKSRLRDCHVVLSMSEDEGATWTEPRYIHEAPGYFVLNNDRVIQTRTGRIIVPVAYHRVRTAGDDWAAWDPRGITIWYYSDDEGATWKESDHWWAIPVPSRSGLQEPGVVELRDGTIYSWSRTDRGVQYQYRSVDDGKSFSPPEPSNFQSPNSPLSIRRMPGTEFLIAVYNDHSGRLPLPPDRNRRSPLVISVSADEGATWSFPKVVEDDMTGWYCYAAIHFVDDAVLLAYVAGDEKVGRLSRLRMRRIPLDFAGLPRR
jgi:hypothetical protein